MPTSDNPLYPAIEPYAVEQLAVSDIHTISFEQVGNPKGRPALFIHGGPGVGISPGYRRFFDPAHYRTVLVDQRGAGLSTPHASLEENTTAHLIEDFEKLRKHLGIDSWVVMGGSWGSLLALCYAIKHPERVAGIIIRGVFLGRQSEVDWIHKPGGASLIYPDEWERYVAAVPAAADNVAAYNKRLASDDPAQALAAAKSWCRWEGAMNTLFPDADALGHMLSDHVALSIARIEAYYTANGFFLDADNHVLDNAGALADIPCHIINGRYDIICPSISAWELHRAVPNSKLTIVPDGAHSPLHGGMPAAIVAAADECRRL